VARVRHILEIRDLGKSFGGVHAVRDVSFSVSEGHIHSVIGPNGAGKTSLFNLISRVYPPSRGTIHFDRQDLTQCPTYRLAKLGVGRTFQNLALFPHETVLENLLVGYHARTKASVLSACLFLPGARRSEAEAYAAVEDIIEFLDLATVRHKQVSGLSYGMRKRVELGRALAMKPKLLLLDEMVSGMNQEETADIARLVLHINAALGVTILMIEHDMGIVMDISDRVTVLNFGQMIANGTPQEIMNDPHVIDAYLGRQ
jgi:branched-chain amino acid transport system ATP-binding protein